MAFNLKRWLASVAASAGAALLTFALAAPAWGQGVATGGGGGGGAVSAGAAGGMGVRSAVAGRSGGGAGGGGAGMQVRSPRAGGGAEFQAGAQGGMGRGGMAGGAASSRGMAGDVRGGAREIVDSIRGRGLAPLRGGQDSFREDFGEARQAFRQSGEDAREAFRDARRDAREARAETRDQTRNSEDRQEAWRQAQETFRDTSEEAREQFHSTFEDARATFREDAAAARDAFLNDQTRHDPSAARSVPSTSPDRRSAERSSDVDSSRSMRDILRANADLRASSGATDSRATASGSFAAGSEATNGAQATSGFRDPTRPLEVILEQNERVREEFRRTGRVPPLPREEPPEGGPVPPPERFLPAGAASRPVGTSGFRDPTRPIEEILAENERIREEFRRTGQVPQLPIEPPVGRPVPLPDRPLPAGTHSRVVDPSEAGRDDSPQFQRIYQALDGPFVPPPEQPTFVPGPGQGFPPPNVPPSAPTGEVPTSPTTPSVPAVPDSLTDLGLTLNAAALARGTLTIDQLTGPLGDLGLNQGDTILAVDGQRITSENQLLNALFSPQRFHTQTTIEVFRNGSFVEFSFVPSQTFDDLF